jgi:D-alanine transaminase
METIYLNGNFIPKEEARISPDDRGFLFADGIYEVVRWYGKGFFDINGHLRRLKRSLGELKINWAGTDTFPSIAEKLVRENRFENSPTMVYLQVTRGAAKRTHYFPVPEVQPTSYAFAFTFNPDSDTIRDGIKAVLKPDIRWSRCDIKSIALLPNTMSFQEAYTKGFKECIFVRDNLITEGAHSNIFFVRDNTLFTHPESNHILSGITRNNIIRMAKNAGIPVNEQAIREDETGTLQEAFISNTSAEVTPVVELGGITIGSGAPGPVTRKLQEIFLKETETIK